MQFSSSKGFKKKFKKLPAKIKQQFEQKIIIFPVDEYQSVLNNHRLSGEYGDYQSINVTGDYRAIYKKLDQDTVLFVDIGTHSQLYG